MNSSLDRLPETFLRSLPPFSTDGLLPPGDFAPSESEFNIWFVAPSERRRQVFSGWNRHREALLDSGLSATSRQLLNGSFTTMKPEPADLDLAVEVPTTSEELKKGLSVSELLNGPKMKRAFECDAYPIYCLPPEDPHYEVVTVGAVRYWSRWFSTTREGKVKGRVWATTGGLE